MVYVIRGYGSEYDLEDIHPIVSSSFEKICQQTLELYENYFYKISLKKIQKLLLPLNNGTKKEVFVEAEDPEDGGFVVSICEILE